MREIDHNKINGLNFKGIQKVPENAPQPETQNTQTESKEIKDLANISLNSYDHFRVYVPKDAVSTEKKNVTLAFKYKFDVISGYYYKASGHQTVTMLGTLPKEVSKGLDFSIVKVPDTATDISGTIYVVGLIVLLCGVGIVYANARPVQSKQ